MSQTEVEKKEPIFVNYAEQMWDRIPKLNTYNNLSR